MTYTIKIVNGHHVVTMYEQEHIQDTISAMSINVEELDANILRLMMIKNEVGE